MSEQRKYFIEIGCNSYETLIELCSAGWTGIMVEPVEHILKRLPVVENCFYENAGVTEEDGRKEFYFCPEHDDWSSFLPDHHTKIDSNSQAEFMMVNTITFDSLMNKYNFPHVDFLKIDAEGYDAKIIMLIDFSKYDIRKIQFEHHHMTPEVKKEVIKKLGLNNYYATDVENLNITFERS